MPIPPSRYQRLAEYLAAQTGPQVRPTFAEVEVIIGARLPASAYSPH